MNQTSGDSQKFDIVFMSLGKEERGFKVEAAGEKENIFQDSMTIKVEESEVLENGTLKTQDGKILANFADYKQIKQNNKDRKTQFSEAKRKREAKKNKDSERAI